MCRVLFEGFHFNSMFDVTTSLSLFLPSLSWWLTSFFEDFTNNKKRSNLHTNDTHLWRCNPEWIGCGHTQIRDGEDDRIKANHFYEWNSLELLLFVSSVWKPYFCVHFLWNREFVPFFLRLCRLCRCRGSYIWKRDRKKSTFDYRVFDFRMLRPLRNAFTSLRFLPTGIPFPQCATGTH